VTGDGAARGPARGGSWSPEEVAGHLAAGGTWRYSRASGPGGQRRDHAETRAELVVGPDALEGLPEAVARRVHAGLGLGRRPLHLRAGTERSREHNRAKVLGRLGARVAAALAPPPPRRRATVPGRAAVERRLADKARRARRKAERRPPSPDEPR
jgi:ribosome-associated protein